MRAVFLDRDGVINRAVVRDGRPYPPDNIEALEIFPEAPAALLSLREAGYRLIVVTNQPDVARGKQPRQTVEAMNDYLLKSLPLDEIRVCYHDDADQCECRKPRPGLLVEAARDHQIDFSVSYMIGDRWRDIEAGRQAGCTTIFIDYQYAEANHSQPDCTVKSLGEAVFWILNRQVNEGG